MVGHNAGGIDLAEQHVSRYLVELNEVEEIAHHVGDVGELVGATVVLAPSIHSAIFHLLVGLQSVSGQDEVNNMFGKQTERIQLEYLVRVCVNKLEHLQANN